MICCFRRLARPKASITANGLEFPDNSKAIFGGGSDLEIYHSGSHSIIADVGTGDLLLRGNNARLQTQTVRQPLSTALTQVLLT